MNLFFELLQVALGTRDKLSRVPSAADWGRLFGEAERQAVVGVLLEGLQRCMAYGDGCMVNLPLDLKLEWIGEVQIIEEQNRVMSKACREVVEQLEKDGFWCCVLKGQANLRYYPEEMANRRICGDIDIWVVPKEEGMCKKDDVKRVLEYIEKKYELTGLCWLHCNYNHSEDVPVEVHFRPSFMNEPCKNRRFLRHFANIDRCVSREVVDGVELPVMKVEEDVIYQMNHIYRHLIDEGVGLRQIVDYYYVLRAAQHKGLQLDGLMEEIDRLGMKRFAGALMYVLKEVCGMEREYLLCEPNEKDGKFLVIEIMTAGNFGQADPRMGALNTKNVLHRRLSQAWRRFRRNMRFLTSYPGEVIWEPFARMYHFAWKQLKLWRW